MREIGMGQDLSGSSHYQAKLVAAERGRDFQVTEALEIVALPGGFIVHARNDHGSRNRREVVSSVGALVSAVERWAAEVSSGKNG